MAKKQKAPEGIEDWVGILMTSGQKRLEELSHLSVWAVAEKHYLKAIVDVDDVESRQEITAASRKSGIPLRWVASSIGVADVGKRLTNLPTGFVVATAASWEQGDRARLLEHLLSLRGR